MKLSVIATGSKGNCYALRSEDGVLLLEAGANVRRVMRCLGSEFGNVAGVLVTHEHNDHAGYVTEFMRMGLPVYASRGTAEAAGFADYDGFNALEERTACRIGPFAVLPFAAQHDAAEPLGFMIRWRDETTVFATDTYFVRNRFSGVNYWIVECNHIRDLMERQSADGELTESMRRRLITSHMSLERLLDLFRANDMLPAREIVLVHLSDSRSDEAEMVRRVEDLTHVRTTAARNGMEIALDLVPF